MDEHRIGLKPIVRGVWAPVGERPIALGHHRFEWLYVTGFVEPATGQTVWNIANAICKELFELILADFAKSVGAGADKRIVLQLDNAGWHGPENLTVPDGIRLVFQPAHSPELQPAEHLWVFVDEPLANRSFETIASLDQAITNRCLALIRINLRNQSAGVGMTAPFVIEGAMNGPVFLAYVQQCLVPTLKRGETVLMDNLPVHRVAGVAEAIEAAGAVLVYLPKYSPDLNPIELAFSKLKAHLRKAAEHTISRLLRRIGRVVTDFSTFEPDRNPL